MKWLAGLVVAAMVFAASSMGAESANSPGNVKVEVMTQNLYIGADLSRLLEGEPPGAILSTVLATDYPERAAEVAAAILERGPDVVGLQEVWDIAVVDPTGNVVVELDYLDLLLGQLTSQGGAYAVASTVTNADVILPVDSFGTVASVVDRDVVLYRTDTTSVENPFSANYQTNFTVDFGGAPLEFTRGYTSVDATVDGFDFRFVNTHLEVEEALCLAPTGVVECQQAQAEELRAALAGETLPVILVGDFNAEPGTNAYATIKDSGYRDTWTISPAAGAQPGFTCCQAEALLNPESELSQRIDHIFVSEQLADDLVVNAKVVGDSDEEKTESGLWYSDHGGVWAKLHF